MICHHLHHLALSRLEISSCFFISLVKHESTTVFGMSATVNLKSLQKQMRNKEALLTGIVLQFVLLPFLGFSVVKALDLSSPMGITLLVLTSSPGGSYSNWYVSS